MSSIQKMNAKNETRYNIVPDRDCRGTFLVIKTGTPFVHSSHRTLEAARQCVRILHGSKEAWTNGELKSESE